MIKITVLNSSMEEVTEIDKYSSFIWTDRYNEAGEFELAIPVSSPYCKYLMKGFYLRIPTSNRLMIIEAKKTETDSEDGDKYIITGRSLESILDRRIVWKQTNVNGSVQNALKTIIDDAFIAPEDSRRRVSNMVFLMSIDPVVLAASYNKVAQYMGDIVYDVTKKVCQSKHLGFKMIWIDGHFQFSLFAGKNRSYNQTINSYVVFSPNHDNLISSKYLESIKNYKNLLRIGGEGEGATRTFIKYFFEFEDENATEPSGLERREIFLDCSDVSSITSGNTVMDVDQYTNALVNKGVEKMVDLVPETAFEGEIDTTIMYKYHYDFEVGDIVEIKNEYGNQDQVRITEVVQTWDPSGYSCVPTLESLSSEQEDMVTSEDEDNAITEYVETTSTSLATAGLKVQWKDIYGSSEDATITYLSHSDVKMTTQLMTIKYYASTNQWKIGILKDDTTITNRVDGTATVYQRGMTLTWSYEDFVNYEVTYSS